MSFLPGDFAREAWNTEKLIKAYEAKKKLEIIGAMTFSSAVKWEKKKSKLLSKVSSNDFADYRVKNSAARNLIF